MKIPYNMVAAVGLHKRHAQMAVALYKGFPRLQRQPIDETKTLTIACYGPSLVDTWQEMKRPIMSMSGSLHWLAERGIIPDYHVDMDPRENKIKDISEPVIDGVHYLLASCLPSGTWDALAGQKITIWHTYSGKETYDWVADNDQGQEVVHGGSTIGLTALHLGGLLGFRHFEIHGMDGSFKDETRTMRHAGPHTGHTQLKDPITWDAGKKTYHTSKIMSNAVAETLNQIASFPMFTIFYGEGLTQALVREKNLPNACCADEVEKAAVIKNSKANVVALPTGGSEEVNCKLWDILHGEISPTCKTDMETIATLNEVRRKIAGYNTGTITVDQMVQLRSMTLKQKPKVIVEIGTFIGNSAMAMVADDIYTCDRDNDCLPSVNGIHTYPKKVSTEMLNDLFNKGIKADMFFFDGRLQKEDLGLVQALSHDRTIYVFDDFKGNEKGVANARLLMSILQKAMVLIEPDPRVNSTLAVMAPIDHIAQTPKEEKQEAVADSDVVLI